MNEQKNLTVNLEKDAERILKAEAQKEQVLATEEDGYDGFTDSRIKLIPTPTFSDAKSLGTMLPINMANETVTNLTLLAQEFDFIDFIKDKLGYKSRIKVVQSFSSEQIDALVLAIKSFEKNNAFILGDMAGIGKGRICAGVIRYTYVQGMIPVFLTQKPYLLNDIYRDLRNIDGMGVNDKGQPIAPRPFVMHNEGVILDRDGNPISTNQVFKTTYKNEEAIYRFVDRGNPYSINDLCKSMTDEIETKGNPKLSKDFNCVMLPYSVISQSKSVVRRAFLSAIAPNSILIFDESHNAASANLSSNILRTGLPLVEASKAVLFSSATYAKNPNVFNLYVVKTALRSAVPSLDAITDALKVGGENVSEYIASGLVKEGQMIRRERSFGDCKKITEYVGTVRREDSFGQTIYSDLPDDTQREFYDEAIGYFKELRDFSKSAMAANAIDSAVRRSIEDMGKQIANLDAYELALKGNKDRVQALRSEFIKNNRGKYIATYSRDSISRYKATFRENLFLAVKAKYSADKIIDCLNTPVEYKNVDGNVYIAPQKPIIAMANTGEAIFNELRLEEGQEVQNDFSEYLRAVYYKMFVGNFKLRKIDSNIFETISSLEDRDIDYELLEGEYFVQMDDFSDGGAMITDIQGRLNSYNSQLPFSAIDYLRDRIENTERSPIYYGVNNTPLYGEASSPYYRFAEGTSRNYMLKRDENGVLRFQKNDRIRSTTKVFRAFNNGAVDVMLINVVASTGGSAQSSPDEGADTRPRNMFIVQFELDINVEVQKRGRINRTGQLNSPTYTYIISKIPVELRKYLMFRKKLRKLDANTSADQTASSKTSEITDAKGNPIEDIFNQYGFDVFKNDFIELPDNLAYNDIFENMSWRSKTVDAGVTAEQDEINIEHFNSFVRELELYPAIFQEYFFDEMNEKYIQKKNQLIAQGEYQEELQAQNYKASLKQRVVIQLNSGSTVFSLPLFLADYFTLESKRALSKDRVTQKANELAVWEGQSVTPSEFYTKFVEDYIKESTKAQELLRKDLDSSISPDIDDYPQTPEGQDKYDRAVFMFEARKSAKLQTQREAIANTKSFLSFFRPYTKVYYEGNLGMFIGYKIKQTGTKFKYTDGNIEFVFCFLSKYPILHLKLSSNKDELKAIRDSSQLFMGAQSFKFGQSDSEKIDDWRPNLNRRQIRRFMAGNILSGIIEANKRKQEGEFRSWALTRFTNIDGSIATAIELKFERDLPDDARIRATAQPLAVAADNVNTYSYIEEIPESTGTTFDVSQGYVRNQNIFPIWNVEGEKICDRAICIVHRKPYLRNANGEGYYQDIVQFEVMQSYVVQTLKETKQRVIKDRKEGEKLYNMLYHDQVFQEMFSDYLVNKNPDRTKIDYAFSRIKDAKDKNGYTTKYNEFNTYIKRYEFKLSEREAIQQFLSELYKKYDVSFNFRSDVAEYFNVEAQSDLYDPAKKEVSAFPDGEYEYRFMRKVADNLLEVIPNIIRKTSDSAYGGVVLSQPLMPNMLPSFEMKPYKFPNEIYVKLTLAVLSDEAKSEFVKRLEEMAEVNYDDAYTIGEYVRSFIAQRSVGATYFFGDLRVSEYGNIFREYALKQDLEKLVLEERGEDVLVEAKPVKTQVTLDDAENFIIKLYQLI
jgi:hypothetical protein